MVKHTQTIRLFISNTFIKNARLKLAKKNHPNAKHHHEAELLVFKIILILHPRYHPKIIGHTLKNKLKNKRAVIHKIIRSIIMKINMKMKNRSHRWDINRRRSRHEHKYSKYKKCLTMMMLLCVKQHLSNIWSSFLQKKISNTEAELKKALLIKKAFISLHQGLPWRFFTFWFILTRKKSS